MDVSNLSAEQIVKNIESNFSSVFTKEDVLAIVSRLIALNNPNVLLKTVNDNIETIINEWVSDSERRGMDKYVDQDDCSFSIRSNNEIIIDDLPIDFDGMGQDIYTSITTEIDRLYIS
jgi:hypothetical protein